VIARRVNAAAGVIRAAQERGRQTAAGIACALDDVLMLQDPETATELAALRARVAELEALTSPPVRACLDCTLCSVCEFQQRMAAVPTEDVTPQVAAMRSLLARQRGDAS
jgi:hypothetical protein